MPVLLLCQGDADAKARLKQAIELRYGTTPPAIEQLQLSFLGRARVKLGMVKTWVPVEASAQFIFPTHLRWDFVVKPLKLPIQQGVEAFDGKTYWSQRGKQPVETITDYNYITSMRRRLWSIATLLLTPMSDFHVTLKSCENNCIRAENTRLNDSTRFFLRSDGSLVYTEAECLNPDTQQHQTMRLEVSEEQAPVDDLILPEKITAYWDAELAYELQPIQANLQPELSEELFTLRTATLGTN